MNTVKKFVTPKDAKGWLKNQHDNRHISHDLVRKYADTMLAGDWRDTHQGIAFDAKGKLCDGAHRLMALSSLEGKLSGIFLRVTRGLSEEAIEVVDSGRGRSFADRLLINSKKYKAQYVHARVMVANTLLAGRGNKTDQQIHKVVDQTSVAFDAIMAVPRASKKLRGAVLAAMVYAYPTAPTKVEEFARLLAEGAGLSKDTPAHVARMHLIENAMLGSRSAREVQFRRTLAALEAHLAGRPMKILRDSTIGVKYFNDQRAAMGLPLYVREDD